MSNETKPDAGAILRTNNPDEILPRLILRNHRSSCMIENYATGWDRLKLVSNDKRLECSKLTHILNSKHALCCKSFATKGLGLVSEVDKFDQSEATVLRYHSLAILSVNKLAYH